MSAVEAATKPHRSTLERAAVRALTFLLGVGRAPVIRGLLETRGYSPAEHAQGWKLLRAVDPTAAANDAPSDAFDPAVRDAVARLDAWDNQNLPILDLALRRREPAVHGFLFAGDLAPADGVESVRVVATFMDRVDALAAVAGGAADDDVTFTPAQAEGALAIMASRGVDERERAAVQRWLDLAQRGADAVAPTVDDGDGDEALLALYEWVSEWTLVARKVVTRKAHLIALGLAEKKPAKPKAPPQPA